MVILTHEEIEQELYRHCKKVFKGMGQKAIKELNKQKRIVNKKLISYIKNNSACVVCGAFPVDAHHITSKGAYGDDVESNLIPLDRKCHSMWHTKGIGYMINNYPQIRRWLREKGRHELLEKFFTEKINGTS